MLTIRHEKARAILSAPLLDLNVCSPPEAKERNAVAVFHPEIETDQGKTLQVVFPINPQEKLGMRNGVFPRLSGSALIAVKLSQHFSFPSYP